MVIPEGWKIWTFSRSSVARYSVSQQLFGAYDGPQVSGVLITITTPDDFHGIQGADQIELRRHPAWQYTEPDGSNHLAWSESGASFTAASRDLDQPTIVGLLEHLTLQDQPMNGFDPATTQQGLPLLSEAIYDPTTLQIMTGFRLSPTNGPVIQHDQVAAPSEHEISLRVSDQSGLFGSVPDIIFRGTRHDDGTTTTPSAFMTGLDAVLIDGTIVTVQVSDDQQGGIADELLAGVLRVDIGELTRIRDETSAWFATQPAVATTVVGRDTITLRGGTIDQPDALCVTHDAEEACRWAVVTSPHDPPSWMTTVLINGTWIAFGVEPAEQADLDLYPWQPDMPPTIDRTTTIPQTETVDAQYRWWDATIPDNIDSVTTATVDTPTFDHTQLQTALRRPDR